ncbi:hypothetical protein M422DRAFT_247749 [Sphaerobolus stellatus SS14]|nr:hypothetical protein M422DRAFT_247749 [Sphaerobolus stellatus SS14]
MEDFTRQYEFIQVLSHLEPNGNEGLECCGLYIVSEIELSALRCSVKKGILFTSESCSRSIKVSYPSHPNLFAVLVKPSHGRAPSSARAISLSRSGNMNGLERS